MTDIDEMLRNPVSRRAFLARMGAAGLGAAATGLLLAGCGGSTNKVSPSSGGGSTGTTTTFADPNNFPGIPGSNENTVVLNYALTLETLEADLYRQAINIAAGKPASTAAPANNDYSSYTLAISPGSLDADHAAVGFLYLQQYAAVEATHRDFLRTALGAAAVPANPKGYTADFGSDLHSIMTLIRAVEETGVRAYLGAGPFLTDFNLLQTAVSIYSTEARHSAAVNYVLGEDFGPSKVNTNDNLVSIPPNTPSSAITYPSANTFEYYLTPKEVLAAVKPFFVS